MIESLATAFIGGLIVFIADRVRWRREDRVRWLEARRAAYAAFLGSVDRWEELDYEAAVNGEVEQWIEAPAEDRLSSVLGVVSTTTRIRPHVRQAAWAAEQRRTELELVASEHASKLAVELVHLMHSLSEVRLESPPHSCGGCSDEHNVAQAQFQDLHRRFVEAVRTELGVRQMPDRALTLDRAASVPRSVG